LPIRIGLLGASRIAPTAVIAPARSDERFTITAVAARDPSRAETYATEHDIAAVAEDYAALICRDDVDVVYNGLAPAAHAKWSIAAVEAGKAVLCEKPFALNAAEAIAMVKASRATGRPLLEAFHYRFHTVIRHAERLVREGALGALRRAAAEFHAPIPHRADELRWQVDQGGGGMMDLGCYPLHALRTLIGAEPLIEAATGVFEAGVDRQMRADLIFPGEVRATIACSMDPPAPSAWLWLEGDRGRLDIVNFLAPQLGCRFTLTHGAAVIPQPTAGPSTYAAQLDHLHDVITEKVEPLTGGADAAFNMTAIETIYEIARRGA
jgi:predicted dehydrogenase